MKSLFITGSDTDVGKTYIAAGLAVTLRQMGIDVGIMKPFAAGIKQKTGFKSEDAEILVRSAQSIDSEDLVNPQFFPISASPYTALKSLKIKPNIKLVLKNFKKLTKLHEMILVEGMGGIMTPILQNYFVAHLIKDMQLPVVIVTRNRIGTINHTIMTLLMCQKYRIQIKGIIINDIDPEGYSVNELIRDLNGLTKIPILGSIPFINNFSDRELSRIFKKHIDFKKLLS